MDDYQTAREIALRFLDYQPRTTAEVRRRLARADVTGDTVEAVIADLTDAGLLDDARFSRQWIAERTSRKGFGRTRLEAELRLRGVGKDIIDEAAAAIDPSGEVAAAIDLARKRLGAGDASDPVARRRLTAHLRRRGYEWEVIERALSALGANDQG